MSLAAALSGIGLGFILWATRLISVPDVTEERREPVAGEGLGDISEVEEESLVRYGRREQ